MKFIDVHSHLQDGAYDADRDEVVARMKAEDVATIIVGTDKKMSRDAVTLAEKHNLWATVGQHPTDNMEEFSAKGGPVSGWDYEFYKKLTANPRVVRIGECGLDYFRIKNNELVIKEKQKVLFNKQINLALEVDKPLMIHGRPSAGTQDAYEDILEILNSYFLIPANSAGKHNYNLMGNVHFFAGSWDTAQKFLDLGFTLSFTGVITFTHDYDEVIKNTPLDMLMAETDAPYVSPVPYRGKRNESIYVGEVIRRISEIKGLAYEKVAEETLKNATRVFKLPA